MPALTLSGLVVYPIKSAGGIPAETWEVDDFGLRHDRRWMLVDGRGRMISQRTHPRLALARPAIEGEHLVVRAGDQAPLVLPLRPAPAVSASVTIWNDRCEALWQGEAAARWFSDLLRAEVSLVYMPETTWRPADPRRAPAASRVSFADAFPFLLLSEESLGDLNRRMATPLPMNRFRPNVVIDGLDPFDEDHVGTIGVGGVVLRLVKPCTRCRVTTTDQATARVGVEPLPTLGEFRMDRKLDGVTFGVNAVVVEGEGRPMATGAPAAIEYRF